MPPRRRRSVKSAAAGSRLDLLMAMRDLVASSLDDGAPAHTIPPLTLRLLEITKEIEAIHAAGAGDRVGQAAGVADVAWAAD